MNKFTHSEQINIDEGNKRYLNNFMLFLVMKNVGFVKVMDDDIKSLNKDEVLQYVSEFIYFMNNQGEK